MSPYRTLALVSAALVAATACPAAAQATGAAGPYAVARIGVVADGDAKFRRQDVSPTTFGRNVDLRPGFSGELGAGYDFGLVRVEGTANVARSKVDDERNLAGIRDDGRFTSLTLGLSGYVDIPVSETIAPYVGAGIGASRVSARLNRLSGTPLVGAGFRDKDWGLSLHLDAGVGVAVSPSTTLEFGARYTRTSSLRFDGVNGSSSAAYTPRISSVSALLGIRQRF